MEPLICRIQHAADPKGLGSHSHSTYEILYIVRGTVAVRFGREVLRAEAPTAIFINCLEEHSTEVLSPAYERYSLTFSRRRLDELIPNPRLTALFRNHPNAKAHLFPLRPEESHMLDLLIQESEKQDNFSEEAVLCCLKLLLIRLLRANPSAQTAQSDKNLSLINEIQRELDLRFSEPIRIAELAERHYISKYYLTHLFRTLTGLTPKEYLLLNRLSCAKELLVTTHLNAGEIAARCGFGDANSLIRSFRQQMGCTPMQYRKKESCSPVKSAYENPEMT